MSQYWKTPDKQSVVLFNPLPVRDVEEHATTSTKVPLVNAPLSLLAIARMVMDDYRVLIFNAVVDENYTEQILAACSNALLFAVSSMTCYQIRDGLNVSAIVKAEYPKLPVVWGGYHPSTMPEQTILNPNIDIVVRGQGEYTFRELVYRLGGGHSLEGICGITYKERGHECVKIIANPDREFSDINEFCDMPYHLIDMERYIKSYRFGDRCIDYETSRGCLARCFFCSEPLFSKHKWTALTPERTVSEITKLHTEYGIDTFMIRDSDFFVSTRRVRAIAKLLIERDLDLNLVSVNGRMEQLHRFDDRVWELLRRAGLREVFIGFESGYQPSLDAMGKGASVDHILVCTRSCAKHDIDLRGSFMVGIPGIDTETEMRYTFEMMNRMIEIFHEKSDLSKLDFLLSFFVPYPGTPLYQRCIEVGFPPLQLLEEWGDFDQFDFHTPWVSDECYELTKDFRERLPCNSGMNYDEWNEYYRNAVCPRFG
ncbi:MAG: radical SAM protein [Euryarchaeota archaeon]|nr:radical SAM protein [Euryarchaeota archaeon]